MIINFLDERLLIKITAFNAAKISAIVGTTFPGLLGKKLELWILLHHLSFGKRSTICSVFRAPYDR
jgi:hypothetical protein